jgi:hypothetical protein
MIIKVSRRGGMLVVSSSFTDRNSMAAIHLMLALVLCGSSTIMSRVTVIREAVLGMWTKKVYIILFPILLSWISPLLLLANTSYCDIALFSTSACLQIALFFTSTCLHILGSSLDPHRPFFSIFSARQSNAEQAFSGILVQKWIYIIAPARVTLQPDLDILQAII